VLRAAVSTVEAGGLNVGLRGGKESFSICFHVGLGSALAWWLGRPV